MSAPEQLYRQFVEQGIPEEEQHFIHERVQCNGLTGGSAFTDEIELRTGLRIEHRLPGRTRKKKNKSVPLIRIERHRTSSPLEYDHRFFICLQVL